MQIHLITGQDVADLIARIPVPQDCLFPGSVVCKIESVKPTKTCTNKIHLCYIVASPNAKSNSTVEQEDRQHVPPLACWGETIARPDEVDAEVDVSRYGFRLRKLESVRDVKSRMFRGIRC